jgi:hypothetical protein
MNERERKQFATARAVLDDYSYKGGLGFRGVPIDHFDRDELLKIIEISQAQYDRQMKMAEKMCKLRERIMDYKETE